MPPTGLPLRGPGGYFRDVLRDHTAAKRKNIAIFRVGCKFGCEVASVARVKDEIASMKDEVARVKADIASVEDEVARCKEGHEGDPKMSCGNAKPSLPATDGKRTRPTCRWSPADGASSSLGVDERHRHKTTIYRIHQRRHPQFYDGPPADRLGGAGAAHSTAPTVPARRTVLRPQYWAYSRCVEALNLEIVRMKP